MFTQLVLILIPDWRSSLWAPGAVAEPRGSPVDLVCMRSHRKSRPLGNVYQLSVLDILLTSQSWHCNMRVLTGQVLPEHKAQREPSGLHGNRGNITMVLGCPSER